MSVWTAGLLLMVTVVFCPSRGQTLFTVSGPQDVYQAEEHCNITLTWLFSVTADMSDSLFINVRYEKPLRSVYRYNSRSEAETYQDEFYRGRVLCDTELARKGRIECVFTDLRLNDTGTYRCVVVMNRNRSSKLCYLNVTAACDQPVNDTSETKPERRRIILYVCLFYFRWWYFH
ncbi:programmed cell death 1 ligand 1-like [Anabas testudineus]|uniref:programmed cell death 1 ligand 1-like n=1 Tax=Anabas testudineus TaxID=64144 RepID=UPI00143D7465|nr:programmed cell death 1 ligand 1-like [Anabas testudineus]